MLMNIPCQHGHFPQMLWNACVLTADPPLTCADACRFACMVCHRLTSLALSATGSHHAAVLLLSQ